MPDVDVALVGLGRFGRLHAETLRGLPGCRLAALCDADPEVLERCGEQWGVAGSLPRARGPAARGRRRRGGHRHRRGGARRARAPGARGGPLRVRREAAGHAARRGGGGPGAGRADRAAGVRGQHLALRPALRVPAAGVRGGRLRARRAGERAADVLEGLVRGLRLARPSRLRVDDPRPRPRALVPAGAGAARLRAVGRVGRRRVRRAGRPRRHAHRRGRLARDPPVDVAGAGRRPDQPSGTRQPRRSTCGAPSTAGWTSSARPRPAA